MVNDWTELGKLFDELVTLNGAERAERLREIRARDETLCTRLEAMLAADAEATGRLQEHEEVVARSLAAAGERSERDPLGLVGATVGRYRVDALLDTGGMGVVYRATDTRLGRPTALKFLPPVWSLNERAKQRFLHEARAASSLDHPNVCTIYEADESDDGTLYIAMAFYDGETLRDRLERGPLELDEVLGLAAQVAQGLAAAHAQGLVHRDIKPANLLVTSRGALKILDFGIAKAADVGLTLTEQRPGTAAYMAPEQARGDAVDGRADLWSLGVVLYEMLTGERPAAAGHAIEPVPTPSTLRAGVPEWLDALVLQLLAYDPDHRPDRAEHVASVLEHHITPATADRAAGFTGFLHELRRRRVYQVATVYVVVAFSLLQLADIVAEPLGLPDWTMPLVIILLGLGLPFALILAWAFDLTSSGVRRTRPPPATNSSVPATMYRARFRPFAFTALGILVATVGIGSYVYLQDGAAPGFPAQAAAATPHFLAVLPFENRSANTENEHFADGMTDDVLAHLAQVPDFSVISRTTTMGYKETEKSVPEIAEELSVDYVLTGNVRRSGEQVRIFAQLVDGRTDRDLWTHTYDRHLEDIFVVQTEIATAIARALEIELSGDVAERIEQPPTEDMAAYDLFLVGRESFYGYDVEGTERAMRFFGQALERDPQFSLARAWLSQAYAHYDLVFAMGSSWRDSAVVEARRAIAEQPDLAVAYGALGDAHLAVGRFGDAEAAYRRALELNPSDWHAAVSLGVAYDGQNRWAEAIRVSRRGLDLNPVRAHLAYSNLSLFYAHLGLYDMAETVVERAHTLAPDDTYIIFARAYLDMLRGRREAALDAAEELAGRSASLPIAGLYAAELFVWCGDIERARDAAEAAYAGSPTAVRTYVAGVVYGYALERTGESEHARRVLDDMERYVLGQIEAGADAPHFRHSLAVIHALRGEREEAFYWLDEAVRSGWNVGAALREPDPLLDALHADPRFNSALDRMEASLNSIRDRVERERL